MKKDSIKIAVVVEGSKYPRFHTSSVVISLRPKTNILFDPGFQYDQELLLKGLREKHLTPENINYVVISHWHIDHCGLIALFPSAKLIISSESITMIEEMVKRIKEAETTVSPVDYLTDYIRNEMMTQEKNNELIDDLSKIRAMANLSYRIKETWLNILHHDQTKESSIVEQEELYLEDRVKIIKFSAHTKGDLLIELTDDNNERILLAGDILPQQSVDLNSLPMLSEDKENYQKALSYICQSGNLIIPGHQKAFTIK